MTMNRHVVSLPGHQPKLNEAHEIIAYNDKRATFVDVSNLAPNSRWVEVVVANTIPNFSEAWLRRALPG